jgi:hypothetical protein
MMDVHVTVLALLLVLADPWAVVTNAPKIIAALARTRACERIESAWRRIKPLGLRVRVASCYGKVHHEG